MPSTPYDAKGLLKTAIRDENPIVFFEDKMMYKLKGPVPADDYTIPLGVADVKRAGGDVTLVACNFTPLARENYRVGVPRGGIWRLAVSHVGRKLGLGHCLAHYCATWVIS